MTSINSLLRQSSADVFHTAGLGLQKPIEDVDFLSHIPTHSPLQSFLHNILLPPLPPPTTTTTTANHEADIVNERIDQFEVSVRQHLLSLSTILLQSNQDAAIVEETIEEILSYTRTVIDVVLHILYQHCTMSLGILVSSSEQQQDAAAAAAGFAEKKRLYAYIIKSIFFRTLPFYLLQDLVDSLPTQTIQLFWNYGPYLWLNDLLCKLPPPFHTTTNKINPKSMKQFIQDENIMLFTQKGQLQILALSKQLLTQGGGSNIQAQFAGQVMMTLASVFPMDEKSGTNNLGYYNTESVVEYETLNDWYKSNTSSTTTETSVTSKSGKNNNRNGASKNVSTTTTSNYNFYETFWKLQHHFTEPAYLIKKDVIDAKGNRWPERMGIFVKHVDTVLDAFEENTFPNRLVKDMKKR